MKNLFPKTLISFDNECVSAHDMARLGKSEQRKSVRITQRWFARRLDSINNLLSKWIEGDPQFNEWIFDVIVPSSKNNRRRDRVVPLMRLETFVQGVGEIILCLEKVKVEGDYKINIGLWYCHSDKSLHTIDWSTDPSIVVFLKRFPRDRKGLYCFLIHASKRPSEFIHV